MFIKRSNLVKMILASGIILCIALPALALTYSERVERYKFFRDAYKGDNLFFNLPNDWIRKHGYSKASEKWGQYLVVDGKTIITMDRKEYYKTLERTYSDYKQRYKRQYKKSQNIKPSVYRWLKQERKELVAIRDSLKKSSSSTTTTTPTTPSQSKNTAYVPIAEKYIEKGSSYMFYFKRDKNEWKKRVPSTRDLSILVPLWLRNLPPGGRVVKVEVFSGATVVKTYPNFYIKR